MGVCKKEKSIPAPERLPKRSGGRAAMTWLNFLSYVVCNFMSRYDDMRFISEIVIYHGMNKVINDSLT